VMSPNCSKHCRGFCRGTKEINSRPYFRSTRLLNSNRTNSFRSEPGESESRFSEQCVRASLKVHAEWLIDQLPATTHEFEH
jgi:hypothetical protein